MGNTVIKVIVEGPDGSSSKVDVERNSVSSCKDLTIKICQELLISLNDNKFEFFHPEHEKYVDFPGHLKYPEDIGSEIKLRYSERNKGLYTLGDSSDDLSSLCSPIEDIEVPVELVEGIRRLSKKKFLPFSFRKKIAIVGRKGCGKSSLLNYILSGNSEYVCPVHPEHETKCISYHHFLSPFESELDEESLKKMMIQRNECDVDSFTVKSFTKNEFEPLVFIDTPGLEEDTLFPRTTNETPKGGEGEANEDGSGKPPISNHLHNKRRILIENVIHEVDIVLFLVEPDDLVKEGESQLFRFIARISEINRNIIIVLSKFDLVVESVVNSILKDHEKKKKKIEEEVEPEPEPEQEQEEEEEEEFSEDPLNPEKVSKIVLDRMKQLYCSFKFGAPVVCVQVKKEGTCDGPNFFSTENLIDILIKYHPENEGSFLYLRNLIFEKLSVEKRIPMGVLSGCMKKKKKKESAITKASAAGTGIGALAGVGTGVVAGGLGILGISVGGLAIVGGSALLLTGVGEILMLLGGGVIAAGAALTAGSVAVGGAAIVVGTSATMALGSATSMLLSKELAEYTLQVPSYARLSMSAFHSKVENIIGTIKLKKSHWKALMKYEEKSRVPLTDVKMRKKKKKKKNWGQTYFRQERRDEVYRDTVVVRIDRTSEEEDDDDDDYFLVEVIMKGSELISIVDVFRVIQEEEEEQQQQQKEGEEEEEEEKVNEQFEEEEDNNKNNVSRLVFDDSEDSEDSEDEVDKKNDEDDGFVIVKKHEIPKTKTHELDYLGGAASSNRPIFFMDDEVDDGEEKHIYESSEDDAEVLKMVGNMDGDLEIALPRREKKRGKSVGKIEEEEEEELVHSPGGIVIDTSDSKTLEVKTTNNSREYDQLQNMMIIHDLEDEVHLSLSEQQRLEKEEDIYFSCPFCEKEKKMQLQQLVQHMENFHMDDTSPVECPKCKVVIRNLYFHLIEHVITSCGKK